MDRALLEMEYAGDGERHTVRLHVRSVDPSPVGPLDDLYYLAPQGGPGAELTVLDTFEAFGQFWAPYYPDTWALTLLAVWAQQDGELTVLMGVPQAPLLPATIVPSGLTFHSTRRTFTLYGAQSSRRKLYLSQTNGQQVGMTRDVSPMGGGYDTRDQDLVGYLSGPETAALMPDGLPILPQASVRSWWDGPVT